MAISNPDLKARIREAAESEERTFYEERIPEAWEEVLSPLGTDHVKAHHRCSLDSGGFQAVSEAATQ